MSLSMAPSRDLWAKWDLRQRNYGNVYTENGRRAGPVPLLRPLFYYANRDESYSDYVILVIDKTSVQTKLMRNLR